MKLDQEIELLYKVYNTLCVISTKGQETLHMASCLNALSEIVRSLESQNINTVTIPINEIEEE